MKKAELIKIIKEEANKIMNEDMSVNQFYKQKALKADQDAYQAGLAQQKAAKVAMQGEFETNDGSGPTQDRAEDMKPYDELLKVFNNFIAVMNKYEMMKKKPGMPPNNLTKMTMILKSYLEDSYKRVAYDADDTPGTTSSYDFKSNYDKGRPKR